jgi:hypothetical protein
MSPSAVGYPALLATNLTPFTGSDMLIVMHGVNVRGYINVSFGLPEEEEMKNYVHLMVIY